MCPQVYFLVYNTRICVCVRECMRVFIDGYRRDKHYRKITEYILL